MFVDRAHEEWRCTHRTVPPNHSWKVGWKISLPFFAGPPPQMGCEFPKLHCRWLFALHHLVSIGQAARIHHCSALHRGQIDRGHDMSTARRGDEHQGSLMRWGGREEVLLPPLLPVLFNLFHKILTYSCYPESPQVTMPQPIWPPSEQSLTRGQPDSSSIALTTVLLVVLPPWLPQ